MYEDQELAERCYREPGMHCECIHQVAAPFYVKWRRGCHLETVTSSPTTSIDAQLREEQI